MKSSLTRHVFRQILHEEPTFRPLCACRPRCAPRPTCPGRVPTARVQRRTLWWLPIPTPGRGGDATPHPRDVTPGLAQLRELQDEQDKGIRAPPRDAVVAALRAFLDHKSRYGQQVLDSEIGAALAAAESARRGLDPATEPLGIASGRSQRQWTFVMKALIPSLEARNKAAYVRLARILHEDFLAQHREKLAATQGDGWSLLLSLAYRPYLVVLAECGEGAMVRGTLEGQLEKGRRRFNTTTFWSLVLRGYAQARDDEAIRATRVRMKELQVPFNPEVQRHILATYAKQRNMAGIKKWYRTPLAQGQTPSLTAQMAVLDACIATKDFEYGRQVSEGILLDKLNKAQWDIVFRWSALSGKGVDEIERLMTVMVETGKSAGTDLRPDVDTINAMVGAANRRGDAYTAERLMNLGERWQLKPNAQTRMLQVEYRLSVDDLAGAEQAYVDLRAYEVLDGEDVSVINRLILKLCEHGKGEEDVASYLHELAERKGGVEPETLAALCIYYLKRQQFQEVIDHLQRNIVRYQLDQRSHVRDVLTAFVLAADTATDDAWDAYCILRGAFDADIDRAARVAIMNHFFARGDCDCALHTFGHMRQTTLPPSRRADADAYTACFGGVAASRSESALETVHNMLKLDAAVEPTTALRQALLRAHLECGRPDSGLDVWDAIAFSAEGPSRESVVTALRCCMFAPRGDEFAPAIWRRLRRFRVDVDKDIADAYIAALAAHGAVEEAFAVVQGMRPELGLAPDAVTFGELINSPNDAEKAQQTIKWVKANYSQMWEELIKIGFTEDGKFKVGWYSRPTPLPAFKTS